MTLLLLALVILPPCRANAEDIIGPDLVFNGSTVRVSVTLLMEENKISLLKEGLQKVYIFYVDIFRAWSMWPDEFIRGKKIVRTIIADKVKGEYKVSSQEGDTILEKRFTTFDSMLKWAVNVKDVKFILSDLPEDGTYFIRVTVESVKQKPPQVFSYVLFFMEDKDFRDKRDSEKFTVGGR
ncbi:MAG: DUF4390 domain-containing protein [Nitrospirae bacterium]|nr:DUF4390 domain-containing protein [Nitrospirota bacterium]